MESIHAFRTECVWTRSDTDHRLHEAVLTSSQLLIPTEHGITSVDLSNGHTRWQWNENHVRRGALWEHDHYVIVQQAWGMVVLLHKDTGKLIKRIELPHLHRVIEVHTMSAKNQEFILLLGERGVAALLNSTSLQLEWIHQGGVRGLAHYALRDRTLVVLQGNHLSRIDLFTGKILWTKQTPRLARSVLLHLNRVIILHTGSQWAQTIVRGLDLDTGELKEEVTLDGHHLGTSLIVNDDLWLVVERYQQPVIETLRGEQLQPAWLKTLYPQPRPMSPSLTVLSSCPREGLVLVQTGSEEVVTLQACDGKTIWRTEQQPLMRVPLKALVTDGVCFGLGGESLDIRRADSGRLLHRYTEFIDEPCLMFGCGALDVLLGEHSPDDGSSTLWKVRYLPALRTAYTRSERR